MANSASQTSTCKDFNMLLMVSTAGCAALLCENAQHFYSRKLCRIYCSTCPSIMLLHVLLFKDFVQLSARASCLKIFNETLLLLRQTKEVNFFLFDHVRWLLWNYLKQSLVLPQARDQGQEDQGPQARSQDTRDQ